MDTFVTIDYPLAENLIHTTQVSTSHLRLAAVGLGVLGTVLSVQDSLSGLVKSQLGDDAVGSIKTDINILTIGLLLGATLNVDNVFLSVDSGDLTLGTFKFTSGDHDFVISYDGHGSDVVLLKQVLGQRSAHADSSLHRSGTEVSLAHLSAG